MIQVEAGTDFDWAIRTFTKRVMASGLIQELKDKRFYLTRTQRRKLKDQIANKRRKQRERR